MSVVRIIFIGTVKFSIEMLKTLLELEANLVGVVTGKDNGFNSDFADLVPLSDSYRIPVLVTEDVNSDGTIAWVLEKKPDVIFCLGWSRLIKPALLNVPEIGVIGYHPAALPRNRGRHPIVWALALGLKETASSFFFMDKGADTGDLISQAPVNIRDEDDAASLYRKLTEVAQKQIREILLSLQRDGCERTPQDNSKANIWRKRSRSDGEIDWRMSASSIHNLVRALTRPYVGAHCVINGTVYKIWKTNPVSLTGFDNIEPGKILDINVNGEPTIRCGDGFIQLLKVEPALNLEEGGYL